MPVPTPACRETLPSWRFRVSSTTAHNVYFSFTTLTTTGFGDLTARASLGHTLSNLEMLIGQIYLVTVVSIVVGNLRPRRGPRST